MSPRSEDFEGGMIAWLNAHFASEGVVVGAETLLFDGGLINSIRVLELIAWTEDAIGMEIPDSRIRMDNFRTIRRIAQVFIEEGTDVAA